MVLALHEEQEYKVEKLNYTKLEVIQPRIKKYNHLNFQLENIPSRIRPPKFRDCLIQSVI